MILLIKVAQIINEISKYGQYFQYFSSQRKFTVKTVFKN